MNDPGEAITYEEWRVTGQPDPFGGVSFPPYDFIWSSRTNPSLGDPEAAARTFIAGIERHRETSGPWIDGPHLHRRIVTVTAWEEWTE